MAGQVKSASQQRTLLFGGIIAVAVVIGIVAIVISTTDARGGAKFDYDTIPQTFTEDGAPVLGDPAAPITIVEFADFQCPHCQTYTSTIAQVIENHVLTGEAKFEFRMFPSVDRQGFNFALIECSVEQGANFWVAHDIMFNMTSRGWNQTSSQEFANQVNVSYGELLNCASDAEQWVVDATLGQQAGVSGTPGMRVRYNDGPLQAIPGAERGGPSYTVIRAAIEQANGL
ncbi:MAG: thioredoxin domain-containing protein [Chloroflexota bacterium]